ncbi:MAG: hypothetical protein CVV44_14600 [Spirochaetae bacterium HGW-Spirochaetae-1]|nr:MAG: hypothetical protein CVV44_14600 [Spirochaetae bacterium HGW-Spirochaetae-1]
MTIMRLVDAHCHLESDFFIHDLDGIIAGARKAGIVRLITASITPDQWSVSTAIARRFTEVECALGVHPWYVRAEHLRRLHELTTAREQGAVAIGEIGLDSKTNSDNFALQVEAFERQLAIACAIDLPVVIHCRGAFQELHGLLKTIGVPPAGALIHSFNGSAELAGQFMKLGVSFSLGGILTYRDSKKREKLMKTIYPRHFLLETDSPDIPPIEARNDPGAPNVPENILYNLRAAAEILGESEEDVAENTTKNAVRIFGLKL